MLLITSVTAFLGVGSSGTRGTQARLASTVTVRSTRGRYSGFSPIMIFNSPKPFLEKKLFVIGVVRHSVGKAVLDAVDTELPEWKTNGYIVLKSLPSLQTMNDWLISASFWRRPKRNNVTKEIEQRPTTSYS